MGRLFSFESRYTFSSTHVPSINIRALNLIQEIHMPPDDKKAINIVHDQRLVPVYYCW